MFRTKAWLFAALLVLVFVTPFCVSGNRAVFGQFQSPPEIIIRKPVVVESELPFPLGEVPAGTLVEVKVVTGETFRGTKNNLRLLAPSSILVLDLQGTGERVFIVPHHIVYSRVLKPPPKEKQ
jgi:uncharacterized oligopeptide transporter (OPT) family protein